MQATSPVVGDNVARRGESGFTLVEALVAIVVLVFGLMAVTNLMLVAASSNSVANQGTAAVASATRIVELTPDGVSDYSGTYDEYLQTQTKKPNAKVA